MRHDFENSLIGTGLFVDSGFRPRQVWEPRRKRPAREINVRTEYCSAQQDKPCVMTWVDHEPMSPRPAAFFLVLTLVRSDALETKRKT